MTDPLLRHRDRFPIRSKTTYLVSHSLGAMPGATREALVEYADLWASCGAPSGG
ncbi:MAG: kynureninase [Thermoanaerobaculia bacterium]|jgi:kynureninase|nr:kynureninase [Thermoanaerobaculia bacterium]